MDGAGAPGIASNSLGCPISPKCMGALHCFSFSSMFTVSAGKRHLR